MTQKEIFTLTITGANDAMDKMKTVDIMSRLADFYQSQANTYLSLACTLLFDMQDDKNYNSMKAIYESANERFIKGE